MQQIRHDTAPRNTGWAAELKAGQILRLSARTIIDFVAFNQHDYTEAFDQAPTKEQSNCIYFKRGHTLLSCTGTPLITLIEDGFEGLGTHDLQFGMCGRDRHKRAAEEGRLDEYLHGGDMELPDHGCAENLTWALEPFGMKYENIPSPVNLFQNMDIDQATGYMTRTQVRPDAPVDLDLRADCDLLVAFSACPDKASTTKGLEVGATIFQP